MQRYLDIRPDHSLPPLSVSWFMDDPSALLSEGTGLHFQPKVSIRVDWTIDMENDGSQSQAAAANLLLLPELNYVADWLLQTAYSVLLLTQIEDFVWTDNGYVWGFDTFVASPYTSTYNSDPNKDKYNVAVNN